jgi:iron(II)-dependent oxidoreductase
MANFAPTGDLEVRLPTTPDHFPVNITPEGVRDLSGNFAEWCVEPFTIPGVPSLAAARLQRVIRGGCALDTAEFLRADARSAAPPQVRDNLISFRAARTPRICKK